MSTSGTWRYGRNQVVEEQVKVMKNNILNFFYISIREMSPLKSIGGKCELKKYKPIVSKTNLAVKVNFERDSYFNRYSYLPVVTWVVTSGVTFVVDSVVSGKLEKNQSRFFSKPIVSN